MIKSTLLFVLISGSVYAAPDCNLTLNLTNATVLATTSQQVIQQNFTVSRSANNNNRCAGYVLYFSKGLANSYQRKAYNILNNPYAYNLHSNINMNGILKDKNDAVSTTEVVFGATPVRNTPYQGSFFISVPGYANLRSGTYTDNVQVSYYRASDVNDQNLEGATTFTVSIIVPIVLNISLVDEGGAFNMNSTSKVMDFGNMAQNSEMGVDLMVSSNTPYQIKFSSVNNGLLKRNSDTYAYEMKVNSSTVNLSNSSAVPVTVATSGTVSNTSGDRYNVRVKLTEAPTNKVAGLYQDTITITAIAN